MLMSCHVSRPCSCRVLLAGSCHGLTVIRWDLGSASFGWTSDFVCTDMRGFAVAMSKRKAASKEAPAAKPKAAKPKPKASPKPMASPKRKATVAAKAAFPGALRLRKLAKATRKFIGDFEPRNQMSQESNEPRNQGTRNRRCKEPEAKDPRATPIADKFRLARFVRFLCF